MVLLTARNRDQDLLDGFAAGVDDFMIKPYSPEQLLARLQAAERVMAVLGAPRGLEKALREAEANQGGNLVVRAGSVVGRILFHAGRIAWIRLSSEPGSFDRRDARRAGRRVARGRAGRAGRERDQRPQLRGGAHRLAADHGGGAARAGPGVVAAQSSRAIVALEGAFTMFAPQPRGYRGELTFKLGELLPEGLPVIRRSGRGSASAGVSSGPVMEAEPTPAVAAALQSALAVAGVRAAALFDAERRRVPRSRLGAEVDGGLVLRLLPG